MFAFVAKPAIRCGSYVTSLMSDPLPAIVWTRVPICGLRDATRCTRTSASARPIDFHPAGTPIRPDSERALDAAHRLRDPLLVLDEREADVTLAVRAEAAARADRDVRLAQEPQGELLRRLARRDAGPDEHRRPRPFQLPADAREPVAERVPPSLVDRRGEPRLLARLAQRDRRRDLQRLEAPVVEIRLQPRERADDVGTAEHERHTPPREREPLRQRVQLDGDVACAFRLEDRGRAVAVEGEIGIREVVHEHDLLLTGEIDEPLQVAELRARRGRVVRKRREQDARLRLRRLPRLPHALHVVQRRHALDGRAGEAGSEEVDGIARARHERGVAGTEQHPQQVDEALLRAECEGRLRLGVELDPVALAVQLANGGAQVRQSAAGRVAMVARDERRLAQLLDGDLRRRHIRIAEAEVDDILAGSAKLELEPLHLRERVRRERVDAPELRHAADRCTASAERTATTSPMTTSAGVATASSSAPRGVTTTSSSSVVPREMTAAGVDAGFPCSISRSASRLACAPPMKATSVPGSRARAAASRASTSCAANAITADDSPRWVTGMPTAPGTEASDETPGTTSKGMPAPASASASSPPRPKRNGSPPFSLTTRRRRPSSTSAWFTSSCVSESRSMRTASGGASSMSSPATSRS